MKADCVFCKIISGAVPSYKIYEDENNLAFLDINPVNPGHILVIPKPHYETILDIPEETLNDLIQIVKKTAIAVSKISDGITITQSNKDAGGQVVPHIHFHVIPRYKKDSLKFWPQSKYKKGEAEGMMEKIKKLL